MVEYRILGPLEVWDGRGRVELGGAKQRSTLTILLLSANRVISVDALADDLYGGAPPATAVAQVQRQIFELRKRLGSESAIETRPPGYVLHLAPEQLDLSVFERQAEAASAALGRGDAQTAASVFRAALDLWRGTPLADVADESFAQSWITRLEEIRLAALEQRIDADLMLGRHTVLPAELEQLIAQHPLRERLRAQLMLALYRAGRQAEALDVYRRTRSTLVGQFGIEASPALHELERRILTQDATLDFLPSTPSGPSLVDRSRAILVVPSSDEELERLLPVVEPLCALSLRELIIARLLPAEKDLAQTATALASIRSSIRIPSRTATFTTLDPTGDIVRLAGAHEAELVMLDVPSDIAADALSPELTSLLERSPADIALMVRGEPSALDRDVYAPFGGNEHDWAALELAAWIASASGTALTLVGTRADVRRGQRDASRLLADASLALQRVVGVDSKPLLVDRAENALLAAVEAAGLVVAGISPRWRTQGIGASRRALVRHARAAVLLVHRGPRPGGLAPDGSGTRFTWTIG